MRFIDSYLPDGLNHYGPHPTLRPMSVVYHVTEGTWTSVVNWFHSKGSNASTNDMIRKDGAIFRFVESGGGPYANGLLDKPNMGDPLIADWVRRGINPNRVTHSIETEGRHYEDLTPAQLLACCERGIELHERWGWPRDGSRVQGHNEFDSVNRPNCPSFSRYEFDTIVHAVVTGELPGVKVSVPVVLPDRQTFPETGQTVSGLILDFWRRSGGVAVCGYPIGPQWARDGGVEVQLFENVRIGRYGNGVCRFEALGHELLRERQK